MVRSSNISWIWITNRIIHGLNFVSCHNALHLQYTKIFFKKRILYPLAHPDDVCCYQQDCCTSSQPPDQIHQRNWYNAPSSQHLTLVYEHDDTGSLSSLFAPTNPSQHVCSPLKSPLTQHYSSQYQAGAGLFLHHQSQRRDIRMAMGNSCFKHKRW